MIRNMHGTKEHKATLEKLLYSKTEAAAIVGVSVHTIARDVQLGRIAALKYGRRVLIPREEIIRIATEGMRAAEPRTPWDSKRTIP